MPAGAPMMAEVEARMAAANLAGRDAVSDGAPGMDRGGPQHQRMHPHPQQKLHTPPPAPQHQAQPGNPIKKYDFFDYFLLSQ